MVRQPQTPSTLDRPADGDDVPRLELLPRHRSRARRALALLAAIGILAAVAVGVIYATRPSPQPLGIPGKWHLVFDSNFTGPSLPAAWRRGWWGNGVTRPVNQRENDCYSPANVSLPGDGTLHLNVTKAASSCGGVSRPFTGGLVSTNPGDGRGHGFQYTYGLLEARVYLPPNGSTLANWPAVWAVAQPGPNYGEDDVLEGLAGFACWHFHEVSNRTGGCDKTLKPGWHTVASLWQKGSVTFYYDGRKVGQITSGITSGPMYLVLDNSTTGHHTIADSMRVRFVRIWQSS